jgi:hypothetical protein
MYMCHHSYWHGSRTRTIHLVDYLFHSSRVRNSIRRIVFNNITWSWQRISFDQRNLFAVYHKPKSHIITPPAQTILQAEGISCVSFIVIRLCQIAVKGELCIDLD